jgi:hypothetical protein
MSETVDAEVPETQLTTVATLTTDKEETKEESKFLAHVLLFLLRSRAPYLALLLSSSNVLLPSSSNALLQSSSNVLLQSSSNVLLQSSSNALPLVQRTFRH